MSGEILGPIGVQFLEQRQIRPPTAQRFGIFTARAGGKGKVIPDVNGNVLAFPYLEDERVVAEKYRKTTEKFFWQKPGGHKTFWNSEAIDVATQNPDAPKPLFVFEGEVDALTAIDCGFECSVSVPDGAPAQTAEVIDPAQEASGKFAYLWNNKDRLRPIREFVLAVDDDEAGKVLAAELVRRLSASRCSFVEYPEGCKDINDVRVLHGVEGVKRVLNAPPEGGSRRPYPVTGLYRLSDYPDLAALKTFSTGWDVLDDKLKLFPGEFMVVTGIPGHGKSTWVLNLCCNVADKYGWKTAMFSPEMPVTPLLRDKLRSMRSGCQMWDARQRNIADDWIEEHFVFIDGDPKRQVDGKDKTLEWLVDKAHEAVMRDDIRLFVIDPWNEIEHARNPHESQTEYIGRGIRMLRQFAQERQVVVAVVAHPTKDILKDSGVPRRPGLYDIDGSAHWANKPDHGVTIWRKVQTDGTNVTEVHVTKVRFAPLSGSVGKIALKYDAKSELFGPVKETRRAQSNEPQETDEEMPF